MTESIPLRISLTGAHSTGKTTLLNALASTLKEQKIEILPEITRVLQKQGFSINEAGTLDTQIMVMNTHMTNLLTNKRFIVDRCLIDGISYTEVLTNRNKLPPWFLRDYCEELVNTYISHYNYIFYLPVEFEAENDGVRSVASDFRQEVSDVFEKRIDNYRYVFGVNIITVTGTVEERVQKVLKTLKGEK